MTAAGVAKFGGLKWKFHTGGMVIGSPAVSEGMVYFGSTDGNLYAVNADSGAQQWKFDAKSRIPSSPAVAEKSSTSAHTMEISMRWMLPRER